MIEKVVFFYEGSSRYVIEKGGKVYKELLNFPSDISSPLTNQNMSKGERHRLKFKKNTPPSRIQHPQHNPNTFLLRL